MMRLYTFCAACILCILITPLKNNAQPGIELDFNKKGEFKIVQFTDTHINQNEESINNILSVVEEVIRNEAPELVVFTGDIVTEKKPERAFGEIGRLLSTMQTPWVAVLGNHDDEYKTKRKDIAAMLTTLPYCLNRTSEKIAGTTNFTLEVGEGKKRAVLYFMDSNAYSTLKDKVDGYGWFDFSQIQWYKTTSRAFADSNNGKPLPAIAFFHIPLPEYNQVWNTKEIIKVGVKNEDVCSPEINTGMFAAMVEAGDVMGTFVGHDHVNDYIGVLYDIALAYGRCSGAENAYGELPAGGRVIVLKEGKREFDTWIHETGGQKVLTCTYPDSFLVKKQK